MIWVNVIPPDGVPRRYAATKGESLLDVLKRGRVPGIHRKYLCKTITSLVKILADCDGGDKENTMRPYQVPYDYYSSGVSCAQCSVHIPDPYFDKLNKKPNVEQ